MVLSLSLAPRKRPIFNCSIYCRYIHLAKSAPTIMDDSLSADAYLNVLYMPSSFPRSERLRRSAEDSANVYKPFSAKDATEDGPRSNLDKVRYVECVSYLQEVSYVKFRCFIDRASLNFFMSFEEPAIWIMNEGHGQ
jgi:zinc finger FYVE domain-containing protein 26